MPLGRDGPNGEDGPNGADGVDEADGPNGANGPNGVDGVNWTEFALVHWPFDDCFVVAGSEGALHCKLVAGFVVGESGGGEGVDEGGFVDVLRCAEFVEGGVLVAEFHVDVAV